MHKKQLEYLKQRYEFEAWCGSSKLKRNLFIWNYFLRGTEFTGWEIYSNQPIKASGWPRFTQSTWRRSEGDTEMVLCMDVYECTSRIKAHEFLLRLLGQFQLPNVERQKKTAAGDVAFASSGDAVLLFARANLVFLVSNAGRELVPTAEIARPLDEELYRRPKKAIGVQAVPEIRRFGTSKKILRVGGNIPLELEISDPLGIEASVRTTEEATVRPERLLCFKFFSSSAGEVFLEEEQPFYKSESAGPQKVTVFAINAQYGVTSKSLELNIE